LTKKQFIYGTNFRFLPDYIFAGLETAEKMGDYSLYTEYGIEFRDVFLPH